MLALDFWVLQIGTVIYLNRPINQVRAGIATTAKREPMSRYPQPWAPQPEPGSQPAMILDRQI